ncbi:MAG: hypothetical protein AAF242_00085 [Bacteroidota bacterium]
MSNSKYSSVFEAHPEAEKIWVVNDMPFLEEKAALDHQKDIGSKEKPKVVNRPKTTKKKATPPQE